MTSTKDTRGALTDEQIERIFYPSGTATENQLLIARSTGRAIELAILAQSAPTAPQLPEDDMALLRPHMSQRTGQLSHGVQQFLKEYADPEYRQRMHEARKRLYAPTATQQAGDGLTGPETEFVLAVLTKPDQKYPADSVSIPEDGPPLWEQAESLGLIVSTGTWRWVPTVKLLGMIRAILAAPRQPGEMVAGVLTSQQVRWAIRAVGIEVTEYDAGKIRDHLSTLLPVLAASAQQDEREAKP